MVSPPVRTRCSVIGVACGAFHSVALTAGGRIYSWGSNSNGELGRATPPGQGHDELPSVVALHGSNASVQLRATALTAGRGFTVAVVEPRGLRRRRRKRIEERERLKAARATARRRSSTEGIYDFMYDDMMSTDSEAEAAEVALREARRKQDSDDDWSSDSVSGIADSNVRRAASLATVRGVRDVMLALGARAAAASAGHLQPSDAPAPRRRSSGKVVPLGLAETPTSGMSRFLAETLALREERPSPLEERESRNARARARIEAGVARAEAARKATVLATVLAPRPRAGPVVVAAGARVRVDSGDGSSEGSDSVDVAPLSGDGIGLLGSPQTNTRFKRRMTSMAGALGDAAAQARSTPPRQFSQSRLPSSPTAEARAPSVASPFNPVVVGAHSDTQILGAGSRRRGGVSAMGRLGDALPPGVQPRQESQQGKESTRKLNRERLDSKAHKGRKRGKKQRKRATTADSSPPSVHFAKTRGRTGTIGPKVDSSGVSSVVRSASRPSTEGEDATGTPRELRERRRLGYPDTVRAPHVLHRWWCL